MADLQVGNISGVTAVHKGDADSPTNISGTADPQAGWNNEDLDSISAMRTRLAVISPGLYTAAYLNKMTYNDMVYAIRLADDPTSIR